VRAARRRRTPTIAGERALENHATLGPARDPLAWNRGATQPPQRPRCSNRNGVTFVLLGKMKFLKQERGYVCLRVQVDGDCFIHQRTRRRGRDGRAWSPGFGSLRDLGHLHVSHRRMADPPRLLSGAHATGKGGRPDRARHRDDAPDPMPQDHGTTIRPSSPSESTPLGSI
jgi:hypothetical protein